MSRESFIFHYDFINADEFSPAEVGALTLAMVAYSMNGTEPDFNDRAMRTEWRRIRERMDVDDRAYRDQCEKNRENARKRWDAVGCERMRSDANGCEAMRGDAKNADIDIDIDIDTDIDIDNKKENKKRKAAPVKHKHGSYQNVLLSDEEQQKLIEEYGPERTREAVEHLSQYIAEKGYKSKSHYLTLRRWVFTAVEEKKAKRQKTPEPIMAGRGKTGFSNFGERKYDFQALERAMGGAV